MTKTQEAQAKVELEAAVREILERDPPEPVRFAHTHTDPEIVRLRKALRSIAMLHPNNECAELALRALKGEKI
jgi:hypothetical protein